jgi:hypothetical protein
MGGGHWPPASPWSTADSWWDPDGNPHPYTLAVRFDSPVNGGGTGELYGIDYTIDPDCPWRYVIIQRADDVSVSLNMVDDFGTFDATDLSDIGLAVFDDIGSISASDTPA